MQDYTTIPNFLFDLDLNAYERTIIMFIARKTIGWGKESDGISLSQFINYSKLSKPTVTKSLKSLEAKKLITITKQKDDNGRDCFNLYQITGENIGVKEINPSVKEINPSVKEINSGGKGDLHRCVKEIYTHKETNTKETITKEKENKKKSEILKNYSQDFEDWWWFYKKNTIKVNIGNKKTAFNYYKKTVEIYTPEQLANKLKEYMAYCKHNKIWTKSAYQYLKDKYYENDYAIKLTEEDIIKNKNQKLRELYTKIKEEENVSNSN